ncbi:hypothetical protein FACS1894105_04270 [Clostridia bacterium]|nr:hypothetical protein FACS1894105_04270 [Clostridia bacterium]
MNKIIPPMPKEAMASDKEKGCALFGYATTGDDTEPTYKEFQL